METSIQVIIIPEYIKTGRIFVLSKTDSAYPPVGRIRTITILPALTKLYELVILQNLKAETKRLNFIPDNQLGFRDTTVGTLENILSIFSLIQKSSMALPMKVFHKSTWTS